MNMTTFSSIQFQAGRFNGKSVRNRLQEASRQKRLDERAQAARAERLQGQVDEIVFQSNEAKLKTVLGGISLVSSGVKINGLELLQLIAETIETTPKNRGGSANKCLNAVNGYFSGKESPKATAALNKLVDAGLITLPEKSRRAHTGGDIYLTDLGEMALEKLTL